MQAAIKERRKRILLTLFLLGRDSGHNIFSSEVKHVFSLPADSPRSRGTIRLMLTDKVITKEDTGVFRITEDGVKELSLAFPFVRFLVFPWDQKMRIVSYEIPERKRSLRDSLRREVSGWGLGPWHRSFWLTPHPITEELKRITDNEQGAEYVQAFEGTPVLGDPKILLEKVWGISKLEEQYKKIFKKWHEVLSTDTTKKEDKMKQVVELYLDILKTDPGLPKELVGKTWIGFEAFDIFDEMRKILL
ncbi:MAG: PaaX family transcriptional regulator C-terminal domain-containing protein [Patescibacteria group bacterium]